MSLTSVLILVVVATGSVLAVRRPIVGLLVYLWLDFMRPHDFVVDLRAYRPMLIVGVVTVAATAWQQRRHVLDRWPLLLPLLALAVAVAFSTLYSRDPTESLSTLVRMGKMLALVWVLSVVACTAARFEAVLWVLSVSLLILALGAIVEGTERGLMHAFSVELVIQGPPGNQDGPFRDNNDLARVLALSVPLWWTLVSRSGRTWQRIAAAIGLAVTVVGIEFTFSRGGFLALVVAVIGVSLSYRPWWRAALVPALFLAAVLVFSPRPYLERIGSIRSPAEDTSVQGRLGIWMEALETTQEHPILGQGPGTFRVGAARRTAHNIFVEVLAETGFVGLATYLWVLFATLSGLHHLRRRAGQIGDPDVQAASFGLEAALLAYLTASLALGAAFQSPLFVLVGLALALRCQLDVP